MGLTYCENSILSIFDSDSLLPLFEIFPFTVDKVSIALDFLFVEILGVFVFGCATPSDVVASSDRS